MHSSGLLPISSVHLTMPWSSWPEEEPEATELVNLCIFAGLSVEQAGKTLGM